METIKLVIGKVQALQDGRVQDSTRPVEFVGEEIASLATFGQGRNGQPTDTRGTKEILYKTEDEQLVVYVEEWSHWQGEPNFYRLHKVSRAELEPGGRFEDLGREAGYGRPLTLDEALSP